MDVKSQKSESFAAKLFFKFDYRAEFCEKTGRAANLRFENHGSFPTLIEI